MQRDQFTAGGHAQDVAQPLASSPVTSPGGGMLPGLVQCRQAQSDDLLVGRVLGLPFVQPPEGPGGHAQLQGTAGLQDPGGTPFSLQLIAEHLGPGPGQAGQRGSAPQAQCLVR